MRRETRIADVLREMKRRWTLLPLPFLALGAAWWGVLLIPGPVELELYDVDANDLVYQMAGGFPGVDISLSQEPDPYYPPRMTGMELAERIQFLLPEARDRSVDETIDFYDGFIVVRATPIKQATVRTIIGLHKLRNRVLIAIHARITRSKPPSRIWPARYY